MTFPTWPTRSAEDRGPRRRDQRGAVLPSPVVLLSIVAVAVAAVAFVATRDVEPTEREITTVSDEASTTPGAESSAEPSAAPGDDATDDATDAATDAAAEKPSEKPTKKPKPQVKRGEVGVVVFNNSGITGLAGEVGARASAAGWSFVAADNWYGTVVATTVYYPPGMKEAAKLLALDLGIQRVVPADPGSDMSISNLTIILTGSLD
ncbi:LytR C-terminal domain-containing protein [Nocardioides sp. YIM 152588]|uniref:LytR C-terminal domain-containing protein n=1 Tax=Nocardioides sp. YIM 152588 TaxID=3158259 RepID=UPI0032E4F311